MITAASEGWTALFGYSEDDQQIVLARQIAVWMFDNGKAFGLVVDDNGNLKRAADVDRFICYCAPDDDPKEIIKRRAAGK